jgi:hypothetical protein
MATTNATIDVSVNGLEKLNKLQGSLDFVQRKFLGLRSVVAGLGLAAIGRSALTMADDLQDLSNSSGIATARLLELQKALATSGGQSDQMAVGVNNFLRAIDEAAEGSNKAIYSFEQVGISIRELQTLGERDLMIKTLEGIAKIEDPSRRAALMMDKFGKSFKTVDPGELAGKLRSTAGSMDDYAKTIARAAKLNDDLATAQGVLKLAFLEAFSPVIDLVNKFNTATEAGKQNIDALINVFKVLATVIAVAFAFTAVGAAVRIIGTIGRGVGSLIGLFGGVGTTVNGIFRASGPVMAALRGVGGAIAAIAAGIGTVLGLSSKVETPNKQSTQADVRTVDNALDASAKQAEQDKKDADDAAIVRGKEIEAQRQKQRETIRDITRAFDEQNQKTKDRLVLETSLVGKSDEQKQLAQAQFDLKQQYDDKVIDLTKKLQGLTAEEGFLKAEIQKQLAVLKEKYALEQQELPKTIANLQTANLLEKDRLLTLEQITKHLENQSKYSDILVATNDKLQDVKFESSLIGLTETQKQLARIQEEARKGSLEAGRAISAQYEGQELSASQSEELARRLEEVGQKYKQISDQQTANTLKARTFSAGWSEALNSFVDNTANAADAAKNIIGTMTKGLEDSFVKFVETGKLSFKDLVNSLIADIARSQIRSLLGNLIGGPGAAATDTLGNIFKGLLGFANGGMIPTNRPVLVGERGPEIIAGAGGRTVIPNNQLGGSSQYVTYNISAVDAMSFKAMIARDPGFIHAVAQQGASGIPSRR